MSKREQLNAVYENVTNSIIKSLESGCLPWVKSWEYNQALRLPQNAVTGKTYQGTNIILLWLAGGYSSNKWLTFKQAKDLGGCVIKGERGTKIIFCKPVTSTKEMENVTTGKAEDVEYSYMATKTYTVFNVQQVEGLPEEYYQVPEVPDLNKGEKTPLLEAFIQNAGAEVSHGGGRAFFSPSDDFVQMPDFKQFQDANSYYATIFHELTHWTGHAVRLNRDLTGDKGSKKYAFEELVAELGAAFLCAELGVQGEMRHAGYIENWLKALKGDAKYIVQAASRAAQAVAFLKSHQG